jgi:hypothetical protein
MLRDMAFKEQNAPDEERAGQKKAGPRSRAPNTVIYKGNYNKLENCQEQSPHSAFHKINDLAGLGHALYQSGDEPGSQASSWERILPEGSVSIWAWTRKPELTSRE